MKVNKKGFTLLEMLVVVLIIGILASVALPQYRRSVNKAKFAQIDIIVDAFKKNAYAYTSAHGWSPSEDVLFTGSDGVSDIEMPGDCTSNAVECHTDIANYTAGCYEDGCSIIIQPKFLGKGEFRIYDDTGEGWLFINDSDKSYTTTMKEICSYAVDRGYEIESGCDEEGDGDDGDDGDGKENNIDIGGGGLGGKEQLKP